MLFGKIFRILGEKNCQVFWETVTARVYELLSTSTKERCFCPFWWENFVFQSVCIFSKFVGFEATFSKFFSIEFFGRVVKAVFRCTEDHFMGKTNLKQPFFLKPFFSDFEQKVLGLFPKIFWQISKKPFYVSRGTVYEKVWDRRRGNKQNFFQELVLTIFGLLVEFFRPICQNCILPSSNFLMESSICRWKID